MSRQQYAKSIRNLASLYRDMEAAAEALEKLGSVELKAQEAEARVTKARAEYEGVCTALNAAREELGVVQRQSGEKVLQTERWVESAKGSAENKARTIIADADSEAKRLVADAVKRAEILAVEASQELERVRAQVAETRRGHAALLEEIRVNRGQLDTIKQEIEAFRNKFGS